MAGACGRLRKASAMNCQAVTTTLKLRSYMSSLLPDHPGSDRTLLATAESGFKGFEKQTSKGYCRAVDRA